MQYSENIDYLFASIVYLGTHEFWWARSPRAMSRELQLDEHKLQQVFDGFPGIYRKSIRTDKGSGQHFYSLQARYAQRKGGDVQDPEQESYIAPLDPNKLQVIINFVLRMSEQEAKKADQDLTREQQTHTRSVGMRTNVISMAAAVLSAATAVAIALYGRHNP